MDKMDPLLWSSYIATSCLGPYMMFGGIAAALNERNVEPSELAPMPIYSTAGGMALSRYYFNACSKLEKALLKTPQVRKLPGRKLKLVSTRQVRREALAGAVPFWFAWGAAVAAIPFNPGQISLETRTGCLFGAALLVGTGLAAGLEANKPTDDKEEDADVVVAVSHGQQAAASEDVAVETTWNQLFFAETTPKLKAPKAAAGDRKGLFASVSNEHLSFGSAAPLRIFNALGRRTTNIPAQKKQTSTPYWLATRFL